ncbi:polypeptide N-acetylgalactosaminyltransferase 13-like [Haliotis rufescens]|uniref:polypeptide N-acetylgalactosaminyltransferase 13-like n=1 Tax=Haliotis rufescens TaxID=6454 RepID=UPI00201EDD50|nr:polypeptide N-acetylgalactosaminyltransferase 13-like [Haliotis rufescens]
MPQRCTFYFKVLFFMAALCFLVLIQVVIVSEHYPSIESHNNVHYTASDTLYTTVSEPSDIEAALEALVREKLDELEAQRPSDAPGELGNAVTINHSMLTDGQRAKMAEGYEKHGFNEYVSDMISLRRRTPDFRPSMCRGTVYPDDLPATSIIICFHNEAWSTLIRTVFSVLDNTPQHLLQEVILVDDASDHPSLGSSLEEYLRPLPKVKLVRASSRVGLIGARLLGVAAATAPVLTFLDSHVECMKDWLQPMLSRLRVSDHHVTYPIVHIINYVDFSIEEVQIGTRGLFHWMDLSYFPYRAPGHVLSSRLSAADPIRSATMPGGIFSMSRRYFDQLGGYDSGLKTWGSENTELSFKVWMCNGSIEVLPCSGIAHVFRHINPNLDHNFYDTITRNAMRVAHVWMDQYKYFFFNNFIEDNQMPHFGDVSDRVSLRESLKCHDFDWYMHNVATDLHAPTDALHVQEIRHKRKSNVCLAHSFTKPEILVGVCEGFMRHQKVWYMEDAGRLLGEVLNGNQTWSCLTLKDDMVTSEACLKGLKRQQWQYTPAMTIRHVEVDKCVTLEDRDTLSLHTCTQGSSQVWEMKTFVHQAFGK